MSKKEAIPEHLAAQEAALFEQIQREYGILDSGGIALLTAACEAAGTARQCRERIAVDGLLTDAGRAHPLCAVQRDARNSFLACIRQLGLDIEVSGNNVGGQVYNQNASSILKRVK